MKFLNSREKKESPKTFQSGGKSHTKDQESEKKKAGFNKNTGNQKTMDQHLQNNER